MPDDTIARGDATESDPKPSGFGAPPKAPPPLPPPPPHPYQFSEAQLLKWIGIPENTPITVPLRRRDIDNLMIGLFRLADAQTLLDATLTKWSNGDQGGANESLTAFRLQNQEGQNRIRQFLAAIIEAAPGSP